MTLRVVLNKSLPEMHWCLERYTCSQFVDASIEWHFLVHEYINQLLKPDLN